MSFLLCTKHPAHGTLSCVLSFVSSNEKECIFCWSLGPLVSDGGPGADVLVCFFIVWENGKGGQIPGPGLGTQ